MRRSRSVTRDCSSPPPFRSICSRARRSATRRTKSTTPSRQIRMPASIHGSLAGTAQVFAAIARRRAGADRRRDRRRLHPARRALRELHPPDHDPLDAAVGGRRRDLGADAVPYRIQHYRPDRRDPAHRHRQEERDPDDRFRHRGETVAEFELLRCDLPGLPAALPADHDDDHRPRSSAPCRWR